jgi:hypothetical protein
MNKMQSTMDSLQNSSYEIVVNSNNRKILVLKDFVNVERESDLKYEDFDAMYVDFVGRSSNANFAILWEVLPMMYSKSWLKPLFLNSRMRERLARFAPVCDGFAPSPFDNGMTEKIEIVLDTVGRSGVNRKMDEVNSPEDMLINMCRYCVSRGIFTFTNASVRGYAKGFCQVINSLLGENAYMDSRPYFQQKLQELGYARKVKFVERIYLCPSCNDSHLMYIESCPKCDSSDIKEQSVIHHFRCANVSPESTYNFDGRLRCPKCKQFLRHIGVDYDRPASVYSCHSCGDSFLNAKMRVTCTKCGGSYDPSELVPFDVVEYEFTEAGLNALVTDEVRINAAKNLFAGYVDDFNNYIDTLRLLALRSAKRSDDVISVIRMRVEYAGKVWSDDDMREVLTALVRRLFFCKLSVKRGSIYIMQAVTEQDLEHEMQFAQEAIKEEIDKHIANASEANCMIDAFTYRRGDNLNSFVQNISEIK